MFPVLVMVVALGLTGLVACGGGGTEVAEEEGEGEVTGEAQEEEGNGGQPSGGGGTWNDIPVYSGVNQIAQWEWATPGELGDWSKVEWRYYKTNAAVSAVSNFYKSQMSDYGWQQSMWTEGGEMTGWGFFMKNNEKDGAMIWCIAEGGDTLLALMRGWQ